MTMKISEDELRQLVSEVTSMKELLLRLGLKLAGGSYSHYKKKLITLGIDTYHFVNEGNKGKILNTRKKPEEILTFRESGHREKHRLLKRAMTDSGVKYECKECGQLPEWNGKPLTLDVDHIDENWLDNRLENLRFLCPNCHSQFSRKLVNK